MKVKIYFNDDHKSELLIKMPCVPIIGDEFTIDSDIEDAEFYRVYARDFVIKNGKLDSIKIWVKDL